MSDRVNTICDEANTFTPRGDATYCEHLALLTGLSQDEAQRLCKIAEDIIDARHPEYEDDLVLFAFTVGMELGIAAERTLLGVAEAGWP